MTEPKSQSGILTEAELAKRVMFKSQSHAGVYYANEVESLILSALAQQKQEMERQVFLLAKKSAIDYQLAVNAEAELQRMKAVLRECREHIRHEYAAANFIPDEVGGLLNRIHAALLTDAPAGTKEEDDEHLRS